MTRMVIPTPRNVLVNSPHYGAILKEYNERFANARGGGKKMGGRKINDTKFWKEVICPVVPEYKLMSWYQFLRRWKSAAGLETLAKTPLIPQLSQPIDSLEQQNILSNALISNEIATQKGIKNALNLGAKFYENLWQKYQIDPGTLTVFEQRVLADSLHKAMKSQDSRIHAIGVIKQDGREEARFEHAFDDAAFNDK